MDHGSSSPSKCIQKLTSWTLKKQHDDMMVYMGVSNNRGGPPEWMVKIMENPIKMDDLGETTLFSETSI